MGEGGPLRRARCPIRHCAILRSEHCSARSKLDLTDGRIARRPHLISYSHDSREHKAKVRELSDRLRREDVDCTIDQYVETPAYGWPQWTAEQIERSTFVLVVVSRGYQERLAGIALPGPGHGVAWESQLITQAIYDDKGRNLKFIPVAFNRSELPCIPVFLRRATHYVLDEESGYEALYRKLTEQPSVVAPPLGCVRALSEATALPEGFYEGITLKQPGVVWRLPRGFLLLEDLLKSAYVSWSVTAYYVQYDGSWSPRTHFHSGYERSWWERPRGIEVQCRKLGIPKADRDLAERVLRFVCDIRNGDIVLNQDGTFTGAFNSQPFDVGIAQVYPGRRLPRRLCPSRLRELPRLGAIRDLASEAESYPS